MGGTLVVAGAGKRGRRLGALGVLGLILGGAAASAGPVHAASPYLVQDTFQRANQSSAWGTASDGMTWSSGSGLSVLSNEGVISYSGSSQFEILGSTTAADGNALVRFSVGSASADTAGLILRHQSNGSMDLLRYDGSGHLAFMVKSGSSWTVNQTIASFTPAGGAFYWLRFEVQGSNVDAKVWADGSSEPSTWTWSGTSSTITSAGGMGLYGYAASGAPVDLDSFSTASPGPTAALTLSRTSAPSGAAVTADASASTPGGNPLSSYTFNFGDGTVLGPQPAATASHSYTKGGVFTVTASVTDSAGSSSTAAAQETVGQPVATLSVSPSSGTAPLSVTASASGSTDTTGVTITGYTFNFGDGTTVGPQTSPTANHIYTSAGAYTATETEIDSTGATAIATAPVSVVTGPTAALALNPPSTPVNQAVNADASTSTAGSSSISSYTFNFGDGTSPVTVMAPADTASHTYTGGGVFAVTVTVTDSAGNSSQATTSETVGQPVAALSVSPSAGNPPLVVTADGSRSSDATGVPITAYTFAFGDGTTIGPQAGATATHTYRSVGPYTVTLTVTDGTGAASTATAPVTVTNGPTAALTLNPSASPVGTAVTADASGSTAGTSKSLTFTFDFGDGTTIGPQAGATATHPYTKGGVFTVTVTVTDGLGNSSQATAQESVGQPTAALTVTPSTGTPPLAVTADASGSTDVTGVSISTYTFNFGDGSSPATGTTRTAGHTYTAAGGYTVTVTVTDSTGATSTATATVTVANPPAAALSVTPASGTVPLTVTANASGSAPGSNPISTYTFSYGDGTVDGPWTADTDSHTYGAAGIFTVTVTVTDTAGLTSSASQTVTSSSTFIVQDTFSRANQSSGWGTATNGMTWSSGSALSVSSNEGVVSYSGSSQYEILGSSTAADGNALVRFSVAATSDTAGVILRHQANGNLDLLRYDGNGHLAFMVRSGGAWVVNQSIASLRPTAGAYYWLRFELQGSGVYVKVWPDGSPEPTGWTWTGSNSTIMSAGGMGLYGYAGSGAQVHFDSFSVAPVNPPAPNSVITGTVSDPLIPAGIAGVTVSTIPATTTASTSSSGGYSLPVASGTYTVVFTASAVGYNDNDVTNVTAPAGGNATANGNLVAVPPQVAMDTFTQPNQIGGWSPSTDGHTWSSDLGSPPNQVPANGAGITGNQAWVDTSNSILADVDSWMGYQYANQEVTASFEITQVLTDSNYQHGPRLMARVEQSGSTWNAILMTIDPPDGSNPIPPGSSQACTSGDISLWVTLPTSTWTRLAMVCQTVSTGTWYQAKLDVVGSLVEGKVWSGATEPGWQISATQIQLLGSGQAGTRTTGSYVDWASFQENPITQISGQVVAAAGGAPISGATVSLSNGLTTTTDSNGNYSLSGLPAVLAAANTYTVSASASGYAPASTTVTPGWGTTSTVSFALT